MESFLVHDVRYQQRHVEYGYGRVPHGGVWKQERIFLQISSDSDADAYAG